MIYNYKDFENCKDRTNESNSNTGSFSGSFSEKDLLGTSKPAKLFKEFSEYRMAGATKISEGAKEKGGDALLTYYHFVVKLPYYKKAAKGKFDSDSAKLELKEKMEELNSGLSGNMQITPIKFQKIVGEIEVLGELLLKIKSFK